MQLRKLALVGLGLLGALTTTLPAYAAGDATAKAEVKALANSYSSFVTNFSNKVTSPKGAVLSATTGEIRVAKPNKLLLHTQSPDELFVSVIGNNVEIYDPFIEVVKKGTKKDRQIVLFNYVANLGAANWDKMTVTKAARGGQTCYNIVDPQLAREYQSFEVCTTGGKVISSLGYTEKNGNRSTFTLSNFKSIKLSNNDFKINYPANTQVEVLK